VLDEHRIISPKKRVLLIIVEGFFVYEVSDSQCILIPEEKRKGLCLLIALLYYMILSLSCFFPCGCSSSLAKPCKLLALALIFIYLLKSQYELNVYESTGSHFRLVRKTSAMLIPSIRDHTFSRANKVFDMLPEKDSRNYKWDQVYKIKERVY